MSRAKAAAARIRGLFRRGRLERDLEEEVRFHLEMQAEDNVRVGMSTEEARRAAMRSFGAVEPMKEAYRERMTFALLETAARDARYAVRTLRRSPGFLAAAGTVLALAIGANTAIFSVLNAVLLRPLPYRSPEQLVLLWTEAPDRNLRQGRTAYWNVEQWLGQSRSFADMAVFDPASVSLTGAGEAEKIGVARVSPNLFALLGVQPLLGRAFTGEEAEQRQRVALISHRFWQTRFGGSRAALGSAVELDGAVSRIIGVLPPGFQMPDEDVWEPHTLSPDWERRRGLRGPGSWFVVGRLRPGVRVEEAQAEMTAVAGRLEELLPLSARNLGVSVTPLNLHVVGARSRLALWALAGAVFCVLLIAAANVASLSVARGVSRAREIAVRAALGGSRARIAGQLIMEGLILTALAGLCGTWLAVAALPLIRVLGPAGLPRLNEASLDGRVLSWALAVSLLVGLAIGIAPAVTLLRRSLRPAIESGGRGATGGAAAHALRRVLVVGECALALMLAAGAGLLVRSWWRIGKVDPGFRPEGVLCLQVSTPASMTAAQRVNYHDRVVEQVEALPGVERAGIVSNLVITNSPEQAVTAEDGGAGGSLRLRSDEAGEGFFQAIGARLLRGRFFSARDGHGAPKVAIVNEAMARRLWPGRDPLGRRFKLGVRDSASPWLAVIGVVGNMRRQGLENEPVAQMFEPLAQNPPRLATLVVRTPAEDPLRIAGAVQAAVRQVEKHAAVYGVETLEQRMGAFLSERRFQTGLLIGFSVVALLMAAVGIYGLVQYSVAARTREIGIRMAVGAQGREIFRMVLGEGLKLSLAGLGLGVVGALWLGRAGSSLLFGVQAWDPLTLTAVSALLAGVAAAACCLPARRAMKLEPVAALREE